MHTGIYVKAFHSLSLYIHIVSVYVCIYTYMYVYLFVLVYMCMYTCNPFIRLLKVLLIIKNPSTHPKFSEYIFKRGQYILYLKLLKSQIFPNSSELGSKVWCYHD